MTPHDITEDLPLSDAVQASHPRLMISLDDLDDLPLSDAVQASHPRLMISLDDLPLSDAVQASHPYHEAWVRGLHSIT